MEPQQVSQVSRRGLLQAGVIGTAASAFPRFVTGAEPDRPLRVGLVGCGGRGTGAAQDAMRADANVKVVALAEIFPDHLEKCAKTLREITPIEDKNCFLGYVAYRKILESDVDYVILATPPNFRPEHLAACVDAGKHVFLEKPAAVDPVGVRSIMESGRRAAAKKLSLVAGTQRRHENTYIETIRRIHDGAIGKITAAQIYWNGGQVWYKRRQAGWSDQEWMMRDWNNWAFLAGDHIVEQHVHNIDVMNWVLGSHPIRAVAMGGRHRRITGDMYDFFATDFTYPDDVHVASQCRQINGCAREVSERVVGQKGASNCNGWISGQPQIKLEEQNPYKQEHRDLIRAIRTGELINEAQNVAESTLAAIMARTSAYTGKEVTWEEMMKSDMVLRAPEYQLTPESIRAHIPVPGSAKA
ncbi:MAG: hypothetical protein AMXMBFR13_49060 [Phycisphaerae bacterium]